MISANELRIGNFIYREKSKIGKIEQIAPYITVFDKLEPIPITEEWLLEFGFVEGHKCEEYHNFVLLDPFYIVVLKDNNFHLHIHGKLNINVQYIHELQNLFFALTKQELEIIKSKTTI